MRRLHWLGLLAATPLLCLGMPSAGAQSQAPPTCFGRQATIVSHADSGVLKGTDGPDVIVAYGNVAVHSGGGDDRICGAVYVEAGPGNDRVAFHRRVRLDMDEFAVFHLGRGDDTFTMTSPVQAHVMAGPGDDRTRTGRDWQWVRGQRGDDTISAGKNYDIVAGGTGDDVLYGQGGSDDVRGGAGNDIMYGGPGVDYLSEREGRGFDKGYGGPGKDHCSAAVERQFSC